MRKILIGMLLTATAVSPALADRGGKGGGKHGGGKHAAVQHHGGAVGGGKHAFRGGGERGPKAFRAPERRFAVQHDREWRRVERFDRPVHAVRYDDKPARKAWKQAAKQERRWAKDEAKFARAVARERFVPVERWSPPIVRSVERPVVRYYRQPAYYAPVRSLPALAPAWGYSASQDWWGYGDERRYDDLPVSYGYHDDTHAGWPMDYASAWPTNYGSPYAQTGAGLFGGAGDGLLGALLPIVLSSVLGGGDLGLGGLSGLASPAVLPLDQVGYGDSYGYGTDGGLSSLLLPSALGSGSLF